MMLDVLIPWYGYALALAAIVPTVVFAVCAIGRKK